MIEMKQMVSRPFSKLYVDLKSTQEELVMPVAIEPLINNKSAILTVLLKLPEGSGARGGGGEINNGYENDTYTSPFVFGSTLVHYDPNELTEQQADDDNISDKTVTIGSDNDSDLNLETIGTASNQNSNQSRKNLIIPGEIV